MQLTKKAIEKKYNCELGKNTGFDDHHKFWVAIENYSDDVEEKFKYADGWTLSELVENIEEEIKTRQPK